MMNVKKIIATFAVALVLVGCIVAAGCTSTETPATDNPVVTPAGELKIVGKWSYDMNTMLEFMKQMAIAFGASEEDIDLDTLRAQIPEISVLFKEDGSGLISYGGEETDVEFTWESLGNNQVNMILGGQESIMTYSPATGVLADESGMLSLVKAA